MSKNVLLFIAALVLTLSGAEAVWRALGNAPRKFTVNPLFVPNSKYIWATPDRELGWINKEGTSESVEEGHASMTFWDFGRRASRPDRAPPANAATPVMIVGASDAQSYGVKDEETFPYLLAQRYPNLWIENFGTGGYSTVQSLLIAERAYDKFYIAQKPKLIILTFGAAYLPRDVADYSWIVVASDAMGRYIAPPHYRLQGNNLKFFPFQTVDAWPLETRSAMLTSAHDIWLKSVAYNSVNQAPTVTRRVLENFSAFAASHDMLLAVVITLGNSAVIREVLEGQRFPTKDCSGLERSDPKSYLLGGTSHPNAALHRVFSDCIGAWIATDLLPRLKVPTPLAGEIKAH